jgi:hypothetical protein
MFVAWNPWQTQRTLSEDDQRGLCSLYPMEAYPCSEDRPCPTGEACRVYEHGTLCTRPADPIGAPCNREGVECDAFCLYGAEDLSVGICSRFCEADPDCPAGFGCREASAGSQIVRVCAVSSTPPDAGPPDAPGPCAVDDQCPAGQHCAAGACTYECREAIDCASGLTCDPTHGRCLPATGDGGGCGCHVSRRPRSAATALLLLALVLGLCRTGRPRFARRAPRHRLRRMNG